MNPAIHREVNLAQDFGVKSLEESEKSYALFTDSTWFKIIDRKWVPFLIENELLTCENKNRIGSKISDWKGRLTPTSFDWVYVLVAILAVVGVGVMYRKRTSKKQES